MLYLSETQSSLLHLVLVLGIGLLLPFIVDPKKTLHRSIMLGIAIILALRYIWWRATETTAPIGLTLDFAASWSLLVLELLAIIGATSAFVILMRTRDRSPEVDRNIGWWGEAPAPKVAILIATYNEELEVLERTITGAKGLRHPNTTTYILDDGRRDWLRQYCAERGVVYVDRPDNNHAKAGNINHALKMLAADPPDYVAVLDADFVPHRGFLSRTLAVFRNPKVGLVQTPQHFFNADPIQHNLNLSRAYPDEQRFFFDTLQASRDAWGIAICCGTSSIVRWQALADIGGLPTESVTEDFMLTIVLQDAGWETAYLNEALTEGLAPEGLKEYVSQRARWCLGMMQIARSRVGPFSRSRLRLRDRWSVTDAVIYWLTSFPFRLASLTYPLLYWFGNVTVVDARVPDVITYFGVYYFWTLLAMNMLARGNILPVIHDVSQLIGAIPITRAAIVGLLKPVGHPFTVTAKGGDRSKIQVQWRMMAPFAVLMVLTIAGLLIGIFSDRFAFYDAGEGKAVVLFWTVYNLFVLFFTIILCIELPRKERHVADAPEQATLLGDTPQRVWMTGLTATNVRLRGAVAATGAMVTLQIDDIGELAATVLAQTADGVRVQLLPTAAEAERLQLRFYTEDNVPGIAGAKLGGVLRGLARRLTFSAAR